MDRLLKCGNRLPFASEHCPVPGDLPGRDLNLVNSQCAQTMRLADVTGLPSKYCLLFHTEPINGLRGKMRRTPVGKRATSPYHVSRMAPATRITCR